MDYPHLRRLQAERDELLHLYARPEDRWRGDQPQDDGGAGRQRRRRLYAAHRDCQKGVKSFEKMKRTSDVIPRSFFCHALVWRGPGISVDWQREAG